jgi:hypothetical protein
MKAKKIHINKIEKEKYYKLGYEKGLKDNLKGMGYEEFKSVGFRYVFLNYTDELAVIVARGYAEGYGINVNDMVVLYPDVEKTKEETIYYPTLPKKEIHPLGYNLEQFLSEGDYCCQACAVLNYEVGFSQGQNDRQNLKHYDNNVTHNKLGGFFRQQIHERGYEDGYAKNIKEITGTEQLKQGTLHAPFSPATYRTKDGRAFYKFRYVDIGGKFEIDIVEQPSYLHRSTDAHTTHRLPSVRGGQKICIATGHEPTTLDGAKNISMQFAELTHTYILSGKTIDDQVNLNARPSTDTKKPVGFIQWLFG